MARTHSHWCKIVGVELVADSVGAFSGIRFHLNKKKKLSVYYIRQNCVVGFVTFCFQKKKKSLFLFLSSPLRKDK
jgi:hypothetical protein